jgi:hypothetical protein
MAFVVEGEDPAITARVREEYLAWRNGSIDRSRYSANALALKSDAEVAQLAAQLRQLGAICTMQFNGKGQSNRGEMVHLYLLACEHGSAHVIFGLDAAGKISMVLIKPS